MNVIRFARTLAGRGMGLILMAVFLIVNAGGCGGKDEPFVNGAGHTKTLPTGTEGASGTGGATTGDGTITPSDSGGSGTSGTTAGSATGGDTAGEDTAGGTTTGEATTGGTTTGEATTGGLPPAACSVNPSDRIAFVSTRYKNTPNVFIADNCTGDTPLQVTKDEDKNEGAITILSSSSNPVFKPDGKQIGFSKAVIGVLIFPPISLPLGFGTTFWDISGETPTSAGLLDLDFKDNSDADFLPSSFVWNKDGSKFAVIAAIINKENNENKSNFFPKEIRIGDNPSDLTKDNFKRIVRNNDDNTLDFGKVAWLDDNTLIYSMRDMKDENGKWGLYVASITDDKYSPNGKLSDNDDKDETDPSVSRNGKKLLFTRGNHIYSCDIGSAGIALPELCHPEDVWDFSFCNHEHKYITCTNERRLTADDENGGACFSSDGKYVYFTSNHPHDGGKTDTEIWRMTADGADLTDVSNNDAKDDNVACDPEIQTIKFRDFQMKAKVLEGL